MNGTDNGPRAFVDLFLQCLLHFQSTVPSRRQHHTLAIRGHPFRGIDLHPLGVATS